MISCDGFPCAPVTNNITFTWGWLFEEDGKLSPLGNKDTDCMTSVEATSKAYRQLFYGGAKLGIDAYENMRSDPY